MAAAVVSTGEVVGGRYRVEEQLGEGGMGAVYAVTDTETNAAYALKVVLDANGEHVRRFDREVKAMMRIQSEHVVKVITVGQITESLPFMVMERLDGKTLKQLAFTPLDEQAVADLFLQACEGLAHAHALGIVHRDIKPSNLFVLASGELKVLDFGIARATSYEAYEQTSTMTLTESVALLGSPLFISPEQLQAPSGVDERADVWSLGVSMYYALTGELPFQGQSLAEILVNVMSKPVPPLAGRCRASAEMIAVVMRCLDRKIERRYRRVCDLADDLAPFATVPRALLAPKIRQILANAAPITATPTTPRQSAGEGTSTFTLDDGAVTTSTPVLLPTPKRMSPLLPIAFGIGLLLTVGAGAAVVLRKRAQPVAIPEEASVVVMTSAAPSASASAPPPADSAEPDNSLELVADAPITRVIKPAAHRVELEDGKAMIDIGEVKSDVAVEVELGNGAHAKGVAHPGDKSIKLTTAKPTGRPHPTTKPTSNSELHKSPY